MSRVSKQNRQAALSPEDAERAAYAMYEKEESGKVRKRPDKTARLNPEENAAYIQHSVQLLQLEPVNMDDAEAVKNRIFEYLEICEDSGMKPSQAGAALALGIDRRRLTEIYNGKIPKAQEVRFWIERLYAVLNSQLESWMQDGKIQPLSGIFLLKNSYFGYSDQMQVQISAGTGDTTESAAQLAARYAAAVPTGYTADDYCLPDFDEAPADFD